MAERRMFSRRVLQSDAFLDLSSDAKCLYFALMGAADDDGFATGMRGLCRSWALAPSAGRELEQAGFLITFDDGEVVLIAHWKLHNYIAKDRYHPTTYLRQMQQVVLGEQRIYLRVKQAAQQEKTDSAAAQQQPAKNTPSVPEANAADKKEARPEQPDFFSDPLYTERRKDKKRKDQSRSVQKRTQPAAGKRPAKGTDVLGLSAQRVQIEQDLSELRNSFCRGTCSGADLERYRQLMRRLEQFYQGVQS